MPANYLKHLGSQVVGATGNEWWDKLIHYSSPFLGILIESTARVWGFTVQFLFSGLVIVMTTLWVMDWILGSLVARRKGKWNSARARKSGGKWFTYALILFMSSIIRAVTIPIVGGFLSFVEASILLTEGASVIRNLGLLWTNETSTGKFLHSLADKIGGFEDSLGSRAKDSSDSDSKEEKKK